LNAIKCEAIQLMSGTVNCHSTHGWHF